MCRDPIALTFVFVRIRMEARAHTYSLLFIHNELDESGGKLFWFPEDRLSLFSLSVATYTTRAEASRIAVLYPGQHRRARVA